MNVSAKRRKASIGTAALGLLLGLCAPAMSAVDDPFPRLRPQTRAEAISSLAAGPESSGSCLTPAVSRGKGLPTLRLLQRRSVEATDSTIEGPRGILLRYTVEDPSFDAIGRADLDADGRPDIVQAALLGLEQAAALLVDSMDLPLPRLEAQFAELGAHFDGYLVPQEAGSAVLVLDSTPREGLDGARRAAIHQFAHAVALRANAAFSPHWAEAFAVWSVLTIDGRPSSEDATTMNRRLGALSRGLLSDDPKLTAGNALWLAFLDEAYGRAAVRATFDELGRGGSIRGALDRAIRRVSGDDLSLAFREFHLWTLLVGERSNGEHFPFADELTAASFASTAEGLPALSVESDPAVAPLGAAQIRLNPDEIDGGLRLHFEGDFSAKWQADLLLRGEQGPLHRVALDVSREGRAETTVPLQGLTEAVLLIRNLASEDGAAHRYTYAAHRDKSYPFEMGAFDAGIEGDGILVAWETLSEQQLFGFNVMRTPENGGAARAVNPIWIPAVGDEGRPTSYFFLDTSAEPDTAYTYTIQGITIDGLTSHSDPLMFRHSVR